MELSAGFAVAAGGGDGAGGNGSEGGGGNGGGAVLERLWTYADVANYLGMSEAWVRKQVAMQRLKGARKLGRATRFIPSEVIAWAMSRPVRN